LHLESNATRCARKYREQLRLIGEVHVLVEGAIAEAKRVVELTDGLADALRSLEGPVVHGRVVVARAADDDELRRTSPGELEEAEGPAVALHRGVETLRQSLDSPLLIQERVEVTRPVGPRDCSRAMPVPSPRS